MPKIAKVRYGKLEYGYLWDLRSLTDIFEWFENVRKSKVREEFVEATKALEGKAHDNYILYCAKLRGTSVVHELGRFNEMLLKGLWTALEEHGRVFINDTGGYFFPIPEMEITGETEISEWVFPTASIRVFQWPNGTHWYAKIGDLDVVDRYDKQKWDTKEEAQRHADWFRNEQKRKGIVI